MTLYELSLEYFRSAELLRGRIAELERELRGEENESRRLLLEGRIRPLRLMYRETRATARRLEDYYRKFVPSRREIRLTAPRSAYPMDHRRRK